MKVFIAGGAGFIGSHAAEFYARRGDEVVVFDNLSRTKLLGKFQGTAGYNWNYLSQYSNVTRIEGDIRDLNGLKTALAGADFVIHAAGQTAVTSSYEDPLEDFSINAEGTLKLLEAIRQLPKYPALVYCSTNKVYGERVNALSIAQSASRYSFQDKAYQFGIDESFGIDLCEHSPYGCSKLTADLYLQDYARRYGIKIGVFRMSCIYGTRQFGVEDQGWLAWFAIAAQLGRPITIYGDGKQVRDVLFVSDLINAFESFRERAVGHDVFNLGGGPEHTLSLLELIGQLEKLSGKKIKTETGPERPNDQKVYISDIRKARSQLGWTPKVSVQEGVLKLWQWVSDHQKVFSEETVFSSGGKAGRS